MSDESSAQSDTDSVPTTDTILLGTRRDADEARGTWAITASLTTSCSTPRQTHSLWGSPGVALPPVLTFLPPGRKIGDLGDTGPVLFLV